MHASSRPRAPSRPHPRPHSQSPPTEIIIPPPLPPPLHPPPRRRRRHLRLLPLRHQNYHLAVFYFSLRRDCSSPLRRHCSAPFFIPFTTNGRSRCRISLLRRRPCLGHGRRSLVRS